jgi:uncharacterized paraquat-inducible protein A
MPGLPIVAMVVGAFLVIGVPVAAWIYIKRTRLAGAREVNYRVCRTCATRHPEMPEDGVCKGCGSRYTPDSLSRDWERTDPKAASARRWRALTMRGALPPVLLTGVLPGLLGLAIGNIVVALGLLPRTLAPIALVATAPLTALIAPRIVRRDGRDFTRIKDAGFRVCPECVADLPELSSPDARACCTRCGQEYSAPWLEATWSTAYAHVVKPATSGRYPTDRAARRMAIRFGFTMLGLAVVLAIVNRYVSIASLPRPILGAIIGAVVIVVLVYSGLIVSRSGYGHTRLLRLRAHGYRFCPECGYDLRQSAASGPCPECGIPFDPENLRLRWESEPKADVPEL